MCEESKIKQLERELKATLRQLYAKESARYAEERGEPEALAAMYPENGDEIPEEWADGEAGMLSREAWQRADHYAAVYSFQKKAADFGPEAGKRRMCRPCRQNAETFLFTGTAEGV